MTEPWQPLARNRRTTTNLVRQPAVSEPAVPESVPPARTDADQSVVASLGQAEVEPPTDVVTAIQLWWAVAVLGVVQGGAMIAMMLGQKSSFIDEMMSNPAAADAGLTRSDIEVSSRWPWWCR